MINKIQIINNMLYDKICSISHKYFENIIYPQCNIFDICNIFKNIIEVQLNNKFVCHIPIAKQYFNGRQYVDFNKTEYLQDNKIICYNENTNINILLCCIDYVYDNIFKLSEIFDSNTRENIKVNFKLSDECTEYDYSKFYENVLHSIEWLTVIDNVNTFNDAITLTNYICTVYDKICCDKMIHNSLQTNLSKLSFKSLPIIPFK